MNFPVITGFKRCTYAETIQKYRDGWLTCGFLWDLAAHDEVFAALLRKLDIPRC